MMKRIAAWLLSFFESEDETAIADAQIAEHDALESELGKQAESYEAFAFNELNRGNRAPFDNIAAIRARGK